MQRFKITSIVVCVVALLGAAESRAQTKPNSGYVAGTQDVLSSIVLADGRTANRLLFQLTVTSDDTQSPFHLATQDCFATYIFDEDVPVKGHGACDGISVEGDMWWLSVQIGDDGLVHWRMTGGTGRFADLQTSGTTQLVAEWEDGKFISRFEGTYE